MKRERKKPAKPAPCEWVGGVAPMIAHIAGEGEPFRPYGILAFGGKPKMPPHFSLNFERGADLAPELRKEIGRHVFKVAGSSGYPLLLVTDADPVLIPHTLKNVAKAEAIARAITRVMPERKALREAWEGGAPFVRTIPVDTCLGAMDVTLTATR